ncbi:hypothetical protein [Lentzea sp. E54]
MNGTESTSIDETALNASKSRRHRNGVTQYDNRVFLLLSRIPT